MKFQRCYRHESTKMCLNVPKLGSFGSSSRFLIGETKRKKKRTMGKRKGEKARATTISSRVEIIIRQFGGKARRRFGLRNVPSQLFIVLSIYLLAGVARYRVKSKAFTGPCSRVPRQRQRKRKRGARTVEKIRSPTSRACLVQRERDSDGCFIFNFPVSVFQPTQRDWGIPDTWTRDRSFLTRTNFRWVLFDYTTFILSTNSPVRSIGTLGWRCEIFLQRSIINRVEVV